MPAPRQATDVHPVIRQPGPINDGTIPHIASVSKEEPHGAVALLDDLGLSRSQKLLEDFSRRNLPFEWAHMGNSGLRIHELLSALRDWSAIRVPRTGHLGNWADIMQGLSSARSYNQVICGGTKVGYPLIFDFNQTESESAGSGDWSYLPGSLLHHGRRRPLDLYSWDGREFSHRNRTEPYCAPLMLTPVGDTLIPLARLHRNNCESLTSATFTYESNVLDDHCERVGAIITLLLNEALRLEEPNQLLRRLFDRVIGRDGRILRAELGTNGTTFQIGPLRYETAADLVRDAMRLIAVAARPESLRAELGDLPEQMPFMSASLFVVLLAVLNTHHPQTGISSSSMTRPCNPHLHWGGIPMAGYPPRERGYFAENVRHLRKIFRVLVQFCPDIDPVFFVLLPASIFNLCPHDSFPADVAGVDMLISEILREGDHLTKHPHEALARIDRIVGSWLTGGNRISSFYRSRFDPAAARTYPLPASLTGSVVLSETFQGLTLQQACMLTGSLSRLVAGASAPTEPAPGAPS